MEVPGSRGWSVSKESETLRHIIRQGGAPQGTPEFDVAVDRIYEIERAEENVLAR